MYQDMVVLVMKSASTQHRCYSAVGIDYASISQMALMQSRITFINDGRKEKQRKKEFPYLKQLQNKRSCRFWLDSDALKSNTKGEKVAENLEITHD